MSNIIAQQLLRELESEEKATRRCLERIPANLFDWKPHEKSMSLGYLALLVADVPKWLTATIEDGEINFASWKKYSDQPIADILTIFDANMEGAKHALQHTTDHKLEEMFYLKAGDQELMKSSKKESISSSINHWVHHRGQLTVYMRLNEIPVPSIYGPSADEKTF